MSEGKKPQLRPITVAQLDAISAWAAFTLDLYAAVYKVRLPHGLSASAETALTVYELGTSIRSRLISEILAELHLEPPFPAEDPGP